MSDARARQGAFDAWRLALAFPRAQLTTLSPTSIACLRECQFVESPTNSSLSNTISRTNSRTNSGKPRRDVWINPAAASRRRRTNPLSDCGGAHLLQSEYCHATRICVAQTQPGPAPSSLARSPVRFYAARRRATFRTSKVVARLTSASASAVALRWPLHCVLSF